LLDHGQKVLNEKKNKRNLIIPEKPMKELIIDINDSQVFGDNHNELPSDQKQLDLNVNLASKYDQNEAGKWLYRKTFKRYEKHNNDLRNSMFTKPVIR
jgi:hypothetical protein